MTPPEVKADKLVKGGRAKLFLASRYTLSAASGVGLTIQVRSAFPQIAASVTGVVLAAVLIFEVIGPILTRQALLRTGEAKTTPSPLDELPEPGVAP